MDDFLRSHLQRLAPDVDVEAARKSFVARLDLDAAPRPDPKRDDPSRRAGRRRRPRKGVDRRLVRAGVIVVVAAVVAAGVVVSGRVRQDERDVVAATDATIEGSPLDSIEGATPEQFASGTWVEIAPPPAAFGFDFEAVWSGHELLVWGGQSSDSRLTSGAAYQPATDSWRVLPQAPGPARLWPVSALTPVGWLLVGGYSGEHSLRDGVMYDPKTDTWSSLPEAPFAPESPASGVWTGTELVIVDGATGRVASLVPGADQWEELPAPLPQPDATLSDFRWEVVWDGVALQVWQVGYPPDNRPARTVGFRLESGGWDLVGSYDGVAPRHIVATSEGLVALDDMCHPGWSCPMMSLSLVRFDGSTWSPRITDPTGAAMGQSVSSLAGRTVLLGGCCLTSGTEGHLPGAAFDARDETWRQLPATPRETGDMLVWTGTQLFALHDGANFVLTPSSV